MDGKMRPRLIGVAIGGLLVSAGSHSVLADGLRSWRSPKPVTVDSTPESVALGDDVSNAAFAAYVNQIVIPEPAKPVAEPVPGAVQLAPAIHPELSKPTISGSIASEPVIPPLLTPQGATSPQVNLYCIEAEQTLTSAAANTSSPPIVTEFNRSQPVANVATIVPPSIAPPSIATSTPPWVPFPVAAISFRTDEKTESAVPDSEASAADPQTESTNQRDPQDLRLFELEGNNFKRTPAVADSVKTEQESQEQTDVAAKAPVKIAAPTPAPLPVAPTWKLSLNETIQIGLANNRTVAVVSPAPGIAGAMVSIERGAFDPFVGMSVFGGEDDRQVRSTIDNFGAPVNFLQRDYLNPNLGLNQIYLRQQLMTGGNYEIGFGTNYERFNPAGTALILPSGWDSAVNLRFTQPLLRGRGSSVATSKLCIAQAQREQSQFEFLAQIRQIVRDIDIAYWELAGARKKLQVADHYVQLAQQFDKQEIERQELGLSAKPQVVQSRTLLSEYMVSRALARREVSVAEMKLRAQLGLAELIYREGGLCNQNWDMQFELPIEPVVQNDELQESLDMEYAISRSMSRPDLFAQQQRLSALNAALVAARNGLLPDVNAYALYSANGLEKGLDDSISTILDGDYKTWGLGLSYEQRTTLRSERGELRRLTLLAVQENARYRQISHNIVGSLRETKADIEGLREVYAEQEKRVASGQEQQEILDELYKDGKGTLFQRLENSRLVQNAEIELYDYWTRIQVAQARWRFERGDDASQYNVEITGFQSTQLMPNASMPSSE